MVDIPAPVREILETLETAGHRAWCVGGCVRDALLGRAPEDWDVTTAARPEETMALFGDRAVPTGLRHGTVTVRTAAGGVEVTTLRRDGAYRDHRRPESVTFTDSLEEDLRRRDFTVNAMAADLAGDLYDPLGGRADLAAGDITYGDIIAVHPYGNTLCVVEATGQEILDALEMASRSVMAEVSDGENAMGENGAFLQVSGLRYTIDTAGASTVAVDETGMFVSCGKNRRVKDVQVLQADGSYAPLEPAKTYTLASHNYLLKQGGDGLNMFMDNTLTMDESMLDYQVLITYLTDHLGGTVGSDYARPQGRIAVE